MREVKVLAWCDFCPPSSRKPSAGPWTVAIREGESTSGPQRVLDVCEEHGGQLRALAETLLVHGAPAGQQQPESQARPSQPEGGGMECPVCGSRHAHRAALSAHLRKTHDTSISNFPNLAVPGMDLRSTPVRCPECGRMMGGTQGLGAHRRAMHGVMGRDAIKAQQQELPRS